MIEIKHKSTGAPLYRSESADSLRRAIEEAVKAGAYLARADLARANLADAYLAGADLAGAARTNALPVPKITNLCSAILAAATSPGCGLDMRQWHACGTTHCIAGWAVHLAGDQGRALEERHGTCRAAWKIFRASGARAPHFFATNERAIEDLRRRATAEKAGEA